MPTHGGGERRLAQHLDVEHDAAGRGADRRPQDGPAPRSVADDLQPDVAGGHRPVQHVELVEKRGDRRRRSGPGQAGQVRIVGIQPDRDLAAPVGEDHRPLVGVGTLSRPGTGAEHLLPPPERPVDHGGVGGRGGVTGLGVDVVEPPGRQLPAAVSDRRPEQVVDLTRGQQSGAVGILLAGPGGSVLERLDHLLRHRREPSCTRLNPPIRTADRRSARTRQHERDSSARVPRALERWVRGVGIRDPGHRCDRDRGDGRGGAAAVLRALAAGGGRHRRVLRAVHPRAGAGGRRRAVRPAAPAALLGGAADLGPGLPGQPTLDRLLVRGCW